MRYITWAIMLAMLTAAIVLAVVVTRAHATPSDPITQELASYRQQTDARLDEMARDQAADKADDKRNAEKLDRLLDLVERIDRKLVTDKQ